MLKNNTETTMIGLVKEIKEEYNSMNNYRKMILNTTTLKCYDAYYQLETVLKDLDIVKADDLSLRISIFDDYCNSRYEDYLADLNYYGVEQESTGRTSVTYIVDDWNDITRDVYDDDGLKWYLNHNLGYGYDDISIILDITDDIKPLIDFYKDDDEEIIEILKEIKNSLSLFYDKVANVKTMLLLIEEFHENEFRDIRDFVLEQISNGYLEKYDDDVYGYDDEY